MDWLEAVHQTFIRLGTRWVVPPPPSPEFYDYSPWPVRDFIDAMDMAAKATEGRRFFEVGCGIGTKLALMSILGWEVTGLDRYQPYMAAAAELVPEAILVLGDMRDVEFFDADVVFMYRPAIDDQVENEMEQYLAERVAPGTVLLIPPETPFFWSLGLERLGPCLWRR